MTACPQYREELSGFVDEILPQRRWEQVAYHLAGCRGCRMEMVEIRELRSTLSARSYESPTPSTLASRLEAIAGDAAAQPLYVNSDGPEGLPSKRARRRRLVAQGSAAALALTMSVVMLALVLAPEARLITDPVGDAREQFAMQTTAINVQEAVGAVLLAQERGATFGAPVVAEAYPAPAVQALPVSTAAADRILDHSHSADATLTGRQRVWVTNNEDRYLTSNVLVDRVAGEGAHLVVLDQQGDRFLSSFLPELPRPGVSAPEHWRFFTYPALAVVADRDAMVLEAHSDGRLVSRWWLDVESGVTLRSERYDTSGRPTIMVAYEQLQFGDAHLPVGSAQLVSLATASSGQTRGWCVGIQECPYTLAGLPLVAYASSTGGGEQGMSLVYTDGVQSLTVSWVEGKLADGDHVAAQAAAGLPRVASWQAGPGVISVATNGSASLLQRAQDELPGREPHHAGLRTKLVKGMGRITGLR